MLISKAQKSAVFLTWATGLAISLAGCNLTVPEGMADRARTVTYYGNGNTSGTAPVDSKIYVKGLTATVLANTGNLGKLNIVFGRWNTKADGTGIDYAPGDEIVIGVTDVALYARWTSPKTITYLTDGAEGLPTYPTPVAPGDGKLYVTGAPAVILANPTNLSRTGYSFAGWNTGINGSGTRYPSGTTVPVMAAMTLRPHWAALGTTYTVTYNANGGTGAVPVDGNSPYLPNDQATVIGKGALVRTGYVFTGWNDVAGGTGTGYVQGNLLTVPAANVILYAQWAPAYSVTYNGNGNTGGSVPTDNGEYIQGATVTALNNSGGLMRTGYTLDGWNTAANGSGANYQPGNTFSMGSANITLYAKWVPVIYSVTYDGNGNTGGAVPVDGNSYNIGNTVTVLGNSGSLVRTGYVFDGWNDMAGGGGNNYTPAGTFPMGSSPVILYAKWRPVFSVTYVGNGNTGGSVPVDASSPYFFEATVTVLGNTGGLVKTGCPFAGWNTQADGLGVSRAPASTFDILVAANVVLYAVWNCPTYTVTYDGNTSTAGSPPVDSNQYLDGSTATVLTNSGGLLKTGFAFMGWNGNAGGTGTNYAPSSTFTMTASNITLYARWAPTYTVTYAANGADNGGNVPVDNTGYLPGATVTVPGNIGTPALGKTGNVFVGWNTLADGSGTTYTSGNTFSMGGSNITLYAKWSTAYTVTYFGNGNTGGTVPAGPTDYAAGQNITILTQGTLVKSGSTFLGWNTQADGGGTDVGVGATFPMPAGNLPLYAKWSP